MIGAVALLAAACILAVYLLAPSTRRRARLSATRRSGTLLPIVSLLGVIAVIGTAGVIAGAITPASTATITDAVVIAAAAVATGGFILITERAFVRTKQSQSPTGRRILVIGAHPDDLELACGGTVASMVARGDRVKALIMSNGHRGGNPDARRHEARVGAAALGVRDVEIFDHPDTDMAAHGNELIGSIERVITAFSPDLILTHSENDYHQDHQAVHFAVVRAARQHSSILCFESPSATSHFRPTVFVDIADHLDTKIHAVREHRDQRDKPYVTPTHIRGVAAFRGQQVRRIYAEGFEPVRFLEPPS